MGKIKVYKIQAEEHGNTLYCKDWTDVESYMGDSTMFVQVVEMDELEYNALVPFGGF